MIRFLLLFFILNIGLASTTKRGQANPKTLSYIAQSFPYKNNRTNGFELLIVAKKLIDDREYERAEEKLLQCEKALSTSKNSPEILADIYYYLALTNLKTENYEKSRSYIQIAINISTENDLNSTKVKLVKLSGDLYLHENNINKALASYESCLPYYEQRSKNQKVLEIHIAIAQAYNLKENYSKAFKYTKLASELQYVSPSLNYDLNLAKADALLGLENTKDAIPILLSLSSDANKNSSEIEETKINYKLTQAFIEQKDIKNAQKFALELEKKLKEKVFLGKSLKTLCLSTLKNYHYAKGDYKKAYEFQELVLKRKKPYPYYSKKNLANIGIETLGKQNYKTALANFIIDYQSEFILALLILLSTIIISIQNYLKIRSDLKSSINNNETRKEELRDSEVKNEKLNKINKEKDRLMSIVAHDLRSPISKAQNLNSLIQQYGTLNTEQKQMTELMNQVLQTGDVLIKDILFSDYIENECSHLNLKTVNINDFVNENLIPFQGMANNKKIKLLFESSKNHFNVKIDTIFLRRIIDNLVSNAIKFTLPLHNIYVSIEELEEEKSFNLIVKDEGIGIQKEDQKFLFKKFKKLSSRPTGGESSTGLGLSITKVLVKKLNGEITFKSETNQGTTFTIKLPKELASSKRLDKKDFLLDMALD